MKETKHDKFLRLMQSRLERTLEEFRLISQLASSNYRNTPAEAHEVVEVLDRGVKSVAKEFQIVYRSWIHNPEIAVKIAPQMGEINEIDAAKAIAHIQAGNPEWAIQHLQAAINKEPR
jgi:hypothetical protein